MKTKGILSFLNWLLIEKGHPLKRVRSYIKFRLSTTYWKDWQHRIDDVVSSADNQEIPRHPKAGDFENGAIYMHNGLRVGELSYYGEGTREMLIANRGVHEPQEERMFQEILKHIPAGGTMLELGSYWAFYSMWFYHTIPGANCHCVEPDPENIRMGEENFELNFGKNTERLHFELAYAGAAEGHAEDGTPIMAVDGYMKRHGIQRLNILHVDTQGAELNVLKGASSAIASQRIDYLFISTHSNRLHRNCVAFLRDHKYQILADIDLLETHSFDGLIVACSPEVKAPGPIRLSRKGIQG